MHILVTGIGIDGLQTQAIAVIGQPLLWSYSERYVESNIYL